MVSSGLGSRRARPSVPWHRFEHVAPSLCSPCSILTASQIIRLTLALACPARHALQTRMVSLPISIWYASLDPSRNGPWLTSLQEFGLEAFLSQQPCGYGTITVDDQLLPQESTLRSSKGHGIVSAQNTSDDTTHVLDAEWEFSCLGFPAGPTHEAPDSSSDRVQFFVFTVRGVDGQLVGGDVGFTVSYQQSPAPQLLRVESKIYPVPDAHATHDHRLPFPRSPSLRHRQLKMKHRR